MTELPKPLCQMGYTDDQIRQLVPNIEDFYKWIGSRTVVLCVERGDTHPQCGPHGGVVFPWDLERYIKKLRKKAA